MLKVMLLLKRHPDLTMDEFIDHYETIHAPLGIANVSNIKRYRRHYLHPGPYPFGGVVDEPAYDVITELWFDDLAAFEEKNRLKELNQAGFDAILADEEQLFDRTKSRLTFIEQHESEIPSGGTGPGRRTTIGR